MSMQETFGSNLGWETDYPDRDFRLLPQSLDVNAGISWNMADPLPSIFLPINHSLMNLLYDSVHPELLTASLNKLLTKVIHYRGQIRKETGMQYSDNE
jgi:hypothetical protein